MNLMKFTIIHITTAGLKEPDVLFNLKNIISIKPNPYPSDSTQTYVIKTIDGKKHKAIKLPNEILNMFQTKP